MIRRFFQGLQERVKGIAAKAMHFVDDIYFFTALARRKGDLVAQFTHIINTGMRRRIDFDQVQKTPFIYGKANSAAVAWPFRGIFVFAIDRFCQ